MPWRRHAISAPGIFCRQAGPAHALKANSVNSYSGNSVVFTFNSSVRTKRCTC